nr:Chain G, Lymphocyte antigen 6 complex locus protein G6d [Homo sapiens]7S4G_I Chain I, Lymphocyte antigen 6 complex locus protein G6d [Homo sapiens]7S4G_J Chain J, Lymphocyte antigen 6 complex locus protein G6d [Homo sapiens]7S4G_K Chain K, Lymphocyte antigen 6 complex locus protein G6d [Homo sapiens]
DCYLGDLCN